MNFDDNWTSCIDLVGSGILESIRSGLPAGEESEW